MKTDRPDPNRNAPQDGRQDAAAELAIVALGYLAGDPERLSRFLALTGIDPGSVRAAASQPSFLAGVLEYVAADERVLVAVASHANVAPEQIERARQTLAGHNWERDLP